MSAKRWPTPDESLRAAREGILDDAKVSSWPDPATVERMREDRERWRTSRRANQKAAEKSPRTEQPA
jgi:hypothetical protein